MSDTMRAVQYDGYGGPGVLQVRDVPIPEVPAGFVRARVSALSLNAADITFRSGKLKVVSGRKFPRGTGCDLTGEVVEVGAGVTEYTPGDAVWGFTDAARTHALGTAAEYVVLPASAVALRPRTLDATAAAALPGAAGAALGVLRALAVTEGERVLVRGAGGGVGSAAVQIASASGARVSALARSAHLAQLRELGAQQVYDYRSVDLRSIGRFDVVVDVVGTGLRPVRRLLTEHGRMATIAIGAPSDLLYLLVSRVHGRRRVRFVQSPPGHELLQDLAELADAGRVRPVIESVHAIDDIASAQSAFEAGGSFGKHVIRMK